MMPRRSKAEGWRSSARRPGCEVARAHVQATTRSTVPKKNLIRVPSGLLNHALGSAD
jgi:hypothetical protein